MSRGQISSSFATPGAPSRFLLYHDGAQQGVRASEAHRISTIDSLARARVAIPRLAFDICAASRRARDSLEARLGHGIKLVKLDSLAHTIFGFSVSSATALTSSTMALAAQETTAWTTSGSATEPTANVGQLSVQQSDFAQGCNLY